MKKKWIILSFLVLLVFIYSFYNFAFITPINIINDILINGDENNLLYGMTIEDLNEINKFKDSSVKYGFPAISFDDKTEWELSKRKVMAKKRIWLKDNISYDRYILYSGIHKEEFHNLEAIVDYKVYDPEMKEGYTPTDIYEGRIHFILKSIGFNKWSVQNVEIRNLVKPRK